VQETAQYWLLGLLLGQTLLAIFGTRILFARLHTLTAPPVARTIHKSHLQVLFSFAWPVAIAAGLSWVQGQGYRYIMDGQLGLAQLGLFVAGYGISAGMIAAFESVLTTYFQPRLYRDVSTTHSEQQAQAWHRYAAAVIPSLVLTVALIMMLAPELTKILLGQNFQAASAFVIWGGLAEAARVLTGVYSLIAHVHMRTRWLILPGIAGSSLSITLCAILIPELGAEGAGIGLALSGLLVVVLMHLLLARRVGGGVPIRPVMWAGLGALALWGMTLGLRYVMDTPDWVMIICMMGLIGSSYLGMQYLLLRKHLNEKRIA
jgi:O-antigen/teichoic acid export membrane protein